MMAVRVLFVACCLLFICCKDVSGCTSGFMEMDVLRTRAGKIPDGGRSDEGLENEFRLIADVSFTCSGTITSFQLGGTIRGRFSQLRDEYPEIQLWRPSTGGTIYTQQASQEIRLAEGDFSPDGVLQYNLTTPIQFQSGDVLGVYQPEENESAARIYYNSEASTTYRLSNNPSGSISFLSLASFNDQKILISPITDPPSCSSNFLSLTDLRQKVLAVNINRVRRRERDQRLFPDIRFTCNGFITKWIVGATTGGDFTSTGSLPELQVWRSAGGSSFTKRNFSIFPITNVPPYTNVYEYTLTSPLEFQEGDILGVYQPRQGDSQLVVYYQEDDGPDNYRQNGLDTALSTFTLMDARDFDYPLVTVEISTPGSLISTDMVIDRTTSTYFTQLQPEYSTTVYTAVSTSYYTNSVPTVNAVSTLVSHTTMASVIATTISTTSPTGAQQAENRMIVMIAVPVALLVIIVIVIMTVTLIIIFTWWRRSHKNTHSVQYPAVTTSDEIVELHQNECYMTTKGDKRMDFYPAVTTSDEIVELQQNVCYMTTKGDKQQEMHLHTHGHTSGPVEYALTKEENIANYKQIAIQQNASYVTSSNKNSKLPNTDVYSCIPDEDEYVVPSMMSTPDISHTSTTDDPISLQQNVSYIITAPNKSEDENRSDVYVYADMGPRCKMNPAEPAMVDNSLWS